MSESKISDFKMLEKTSFSGINTEKIVETYMRVVKEKEKKIGREYTSTFIKNMLRLTVHLAGTEVSEEVRTLDQLEKYLLSKKDELRVPPHFLVFWVHFITDEMFESSQDSLTQLTFSVPAKRLMERDSEIGTKKFDVDQILVKLRRLTVSMKVAPPEFGYRKNADGSIDILYGHCPFFEGCEKSWEQNLARRRDGRIICGATLFVSQFLGLATNQEWDHALLEFDKTRCIARCFPT